MTYIAAIALGMMFGFVAAIVPAIVLWAAAARSGQVEDNEPN